MLLSDTVGFIRDLPHHLIASFKATLEEARQADLLLHVADAREPGGVLSQITAVYGVLEELGIEAKDTLLVLNKIDAVPDRGRVDRPAGPLSERAADQRSPRDRLAATGRRGQRGAEPQLSRRRHRNGRGKRPAAGLSGRARRSAFEAISRRPRGDPLPHLAGSSRPHPRRCDRRPPAFERLSGKRAS